MNIPEPFKDYIGDGVYASFDGFGFWLRTEREFGVHEIYLEPNVLKALLDFEKRAKEEMRP